MPNVQDKRERDDAKLPPALAKLFNLTNDPNNQSTTLQTKHPALQSVVGFFDKLANSLNKDNPNAQIALQKQQTQQGTTNLNMMIPNAMMNAFLQQLSKLLPQLQNLLNQAPGQHSSPTPLPTRPKPPGTII